MAKASVTKTCPKCGKEHEWTTIKYNRREADEWESWANEQEHLCPDCYRAEQRKNALEAAQKIADDNGLVPLTGSEKQVSWALQIRSETLSRVTRYHPKEDHLRSLLDRINAHTEAHWWIDKRDYASVEIMREAEELTIKRLPNDEQAKLLAEARKTISDLTGTPHGDIGMLRIAQAKSILRILGEIA